MRSNAMPLPVADQKCWRSSATVCVGQSQQSGRFDWELWPGASGHLTSVLTYSIGALTYRNGRGKQDWPCALLFPSFEKGATEPMDWPGTAAHGRRHNLGTHQLISEHPPQWQVHKKLESHTRRQRPVMRQPPSI